MKIRYCTKYSIFFMVFLMSAPINAVQIHVTRHCYIANRLAWLTSLLLHFFFFNWSIYDSEQTGFSYVNVIKNKQTKTKPTVNVKLSGERLNFFLLRWRTKQGFLSHNFYSIFLLEFLVREIRKEKKSRLENYNSLSKFQATFW